MSGLANVVRFGNPMLNERGKAQCRARRKKGVSTQTSRNRLDVKGTEEKKWKWEDFGLHRGKPQTEVKTNNGVDSRRKKIIAACSERGATVKESEIWLSILIRLSQLKVGVFLTKGNRSTIFGETCSYVSMLYVSGHVISTPAHGETRRRRREWELNKSHNSQCRSSGLIS